MSLDPIISFAVVILPTLFALGIEVIDEKFRKNTRWRCGVIVFGVTLSGLTLWQQSRSANAAKVDQEIAIQKTAATVATETAARVTGSLNNQYGPVISGLYKNISELEGRIEGQSRLRQQELALNYVPSVDLIYAGDKLQIWNRGKTNLNLSGDKYDDELPDVAATSYVISPQTNYYLLANRLNEYILAKLGRNGEARVPLDIYITTANNQRYIMHAELWEIVKDGEITIHTQNHGFDKKDWSSR